MQVESIRNHTTCMGFYINRISIIQLLVIPEYTVVFMDTHFNFSNKHKTFINVNYLHMNTL